MRINQGPAAGHVVNTIYKFGQGGFLTVLTVSSPLPLQRILSFYGGFRYSRRDGEIVLRKVLLRYDVSTLVSDGAGLRQIALILRNKLSRSFLSISPHTQAVVLLPYGFETQGKKQALDGLGSRQN